MLAFRDISKAQMITDLPLRQGPQAQLACRDQAGNMNV